MPSDFLRDENRTTNGKYNNTWQTKSMGVYIHFRDAEPPVDQVCKVWPQWLQLLNFELSGCHLAPYPSKLFNLGQMEK